MAHYRKIIVNGHEWEWCVGGRGVILRDGKQKHTVSLEEIHVSRRDMEKGNARITPSIIANYIKTKEKK